MPGFTIYKYIAGIPIHSVFIGQIFVTQCVCDIARYTFVYIKITRIIKVNPFYDDTTADEKYRFTCPVVFFAMEPSWKGLISVTE